jgi:hypothetical protein
VFKMGLLRKKTSAKAQTPSSSRPVWRGKGVGHSVYQRWSAQALRAHGQQRRAAIDKWRNRLDLHRNLTRAHGGEQRQGGDRREHDQGAATPNQGSSGSYLLNT